MWIDTWAWLMESPWVMPSWQFESLIWGISSGFPLTNHFDLPGSQSIFGISQDSSMCAHASFSLDGFYWRGLWLECPLASLPLWPPGVFLHMCGQGGLQTLRIRNMWSGQGPASSLNCPAVLVLQFQSTGWNKSPVIYLGKGPIYLLPQIESTDVGPVEREGRLKSV